MLVTKKDIINKILVFLKILRFPLWQKVASLILVLLESVANNVVDLVFLDNSLSGWEGCRFFYFSLSASGVM